MPDWWIRKVRWKRRGNRCEARVRPRSGGWTGCRWRSRTISMWPADHGRLPGRRGRAETDIVSRLRGAGAVLLGKPIWTRPLQARSGAMRITAMSQSVPAGAGQWRFLGRFGGGGCGRHAVAALGSTPGFGADSGRVLRRDRFQAGLRRAFLSRHGTCCGAWIAPASSRQAGHRAVAANHGHYDAADPRSRRRRVALALPDWDPSCLRVACWPMRLRPVPSRRWPARSRARCSAPGLFSRPRSLI